MSKRPTIAEIEKAIDWPWQGWAQQCHAVSLHIVKSGVVGPSRVARGTCLGVGGQHSWVVLGMDCYAPNAKILDPTLWSYDASVSGLWWGSAKDGRHVPHGRGTIWAWGKPHTTGEDPIPLGVPLSPPAQRFMDLIGPLDRRGWLMLADAPVEGWPAAEILAAMYRTPKLSAFVPIDKIGMLTMINPSGLYLPGEGDE